jgi:hypothetical protein
VWPERPPSPSQGHEEWTCKTVDKALAFARTRGKNESKQECQKRSSFAWPRFKMLLSRKWLALFGVVAIASGGLFVWDRHRERPNPIPFADLDTLFAVERGTEWKIHNSPRLEGPYRVLSGTYVERSPGIKSTIRLRDASGTVMEEINVEGAMDRDFLFHELETADGQKTMVGLVRVMKN